MGTLENLVVGNAAGTAKHMPEVEKLTRSGVTRITVGSITKEEREGNSGSTYHYDEESGASVNAIGLKNPGMARYQKILPQMVKMAHNADKQLWASVAGFAIIDFGTLVHECMFAGVDGVELNLGCPNVHDGGTQKPIFSYDPALSEKVLQHVRALIEYDGRHCNIAVKISPVPDEVILPLANAITRSGIVTEVVAVNTLPNKRLFLPDGRSVLAFKAPGSDEVKDTGGLAGTPLLEEGLRVVRGMREHLPNYIKVIGCGGISKGKHLREYLDEGANGFECATAYLEQGPRVFSDIMEKCFTLADAESAE